MKRIFSIIMEWTLAYPRALLPSGGPLSREFLQLTTHLTYISYSNFNLSRHQAPISASPTMAHRLRRWTNVKTAPTLSELMNKAVCLL